MERTYQLMIIGAGAGGIAAAKYAIQEGITSFVVLEKQAELGGVWNP